MSTGLNLQVASAYVDLEMRMSRFNTQMNQVRAQLQRIATRPVRVNIEMPTARITRQMNQVRAQLRQLSTRPIRINVQISGAPQAVAALRNLSRTLNDLNAVITRTRRNARGLNLRGLGAGRGGGGWGHGGGTLGNFASGFASGMGLPFTMHPAMLAGAVTATSIGGAFRMAGRGYDAVEAGLGSATHTAMELETRFAKLRKTTGATGDQFNKLRGDLTNLATTMRGVSFNELLDTATMGGRLGVKNDQITNFTRDIAMIRVALDDIPAEEAATSISRILNVFGRGTEDAIRFASALNKLDDTSTATGRDILDLARRMAPGASVFAGFTPQKVLGLATALKDAGASNYTAGTAITNTLARMATHTDKFAKTAGMSIEEFTKLLKADPLEAMKAFVKGFQKFDEVGQWQALDELKMKGAGAKMTLLQLGAVMDKLNGYVATANQEWRSLASIQSEYDAMGSTTQAILQRMSNQFQILSGQIGEAVLPIVKAAADAFTGLAGDIAAALTRNKGTIEAWSTKIASAVAVVRVAFKEWPTTLRFAEEAMNVVLSSIQDNFAKVALYITKVYIAAWTDAFSAVNTMFANSLNNMVAEIANHPLRQVLETLIPGLGDAMFGLEQLGMVPQKKPLMQGFNPILPGVVKDFPALKAPDLKQLGDLGQQLKDALAPQVAAEKVKGFFQRPDVGVIRDAVGEGMAAAMAGNGGQAGAAIAKGFDQALAKLGVGEGVGRLAAAAFGARVGGLPGLMGVLGAGAPKRKAGVQAFNDDDEEADEENGPVKGKRGRPKAPPVFMPDVAGARFKGDLKAQIAAKDAELKKANKLVGVREAEEGKLHQHFIDQNGVGFGGQFTDDQNRRLEAAATARAKAFEKAQNLEQEKEFLEKRLKNAEGLKPGEGVNPQVGKLTAAVLAKREEEKKAEEALKQRSKETAALDGKIALTPFGAADLEKKQDAARAREQAAKDRLNAIAQEKWALIDKLQAAEKAPASMEQKKGEAAARAVVPAPAGGAAAANGMNAAGAKMREAADRANFGERMNNDQKQESQCCKDTAVNTGKTVEVLNRVADLLAAIERKAGQAVLAP